MVKEKLNFQKMGGLIPVVIQDYQDNEVLMVGFMNEQAWKLTVKTGKVHYWSRKKKRLWLKGEESGHFQFVKEIYLDNDNDSLLIKVDQIGGAVEDGYRTCFYKMKRGNKFVIVGQKVFDPKKVYKNYSEDIIFAIPSGSLYSMTIILLEKAGYHLKLRGERSYRPGIAEENIKLLVVRAEEIPDLIEEEGADIGLTGLDLAEEKGVSIMDLADLKYNELGIGPINWVLAVPKEKAKNYKKLSDFSSKRISTELVNTTKQFFLKNNVNIFVEPSVGATEAKTPLLADAIVDLCETGQSLKENGLVPLYNVKSSTVHLFANNHSMAYGWKRRKIEEIEEKLKVAAKKLPKNTKKLIKLPDK